MVFVAVSHGLGQTYDEVSESDAKSIGNVRFLRCLSEMENSNTGFSDDHRRECPILLDGCSD